MTKKMFRLVLSLALIYSLCVPAMALDLSVGQLGIYSEECPVEAQEYARDNYSRFLIASVESGAFQVGGNIVLGSPFTVFSESPEITVYYFPIISDETIVATFRIGKIPGIDCYTGVMSKFLADELDALSKEPEQTTPFLLFTDGYDVAAIKDDGTYISYGRNGFSPQAKYAQSTAGLTVVDPLKPLASTSSNIITSPNTSGRVSFYIHLDITEIQGQNEWCYAYATAMIIRTLTDYNPMAEDIMSYCTGGNYSSQTSLSIFDVEKAGKHYGLSPAIIPSTISPYSELNNERPIFLRAQSIATPTTALSDSANDPMELNGKGYHAFVMNGYDLIDSVYSVWNPWRPYCETMDATTKVYIADSGAVYKWIQTVNNW